MIQEFLQTYFNQTEIYLLYVLAFLFLYEVYHYGRFMSGCLRAKKIEPKEQPGVSVIVCAKNEEVNLRDYLQVICTQDYPQYEIIVVNDGSVDGTNDVLNIYKLNNDNVKLTFVPQDTHLTSTKKLGIMLGVKAAQYDYILLTDADCRPANNQWIKEMMSHFEPKIDLVLGFSPVFEKSTTLNKLIEYDTLTVGMLYLGLAKSGKAYMGVGRNMAYRKSKFYEVGGFRNLTHNRAGDDDLIVQKIANDNNVAICFGKDSTVWTPAKTTWKTWVKQKRRHLSVAPQYTTSSKIRLTVEPIFRGLFYATVIAMIVLGGFEAQMVAVGAFILRWGLQKILINGTAKRVNIRPFSGLMVLFADIFLPLMTFFLLNTNSNYKRQYTKW